MTTLGAVLLALAFCISSGRSRLAARISNVGETPIVVTTVPGTTRKTQTGIVLTTMLVLIVAKLGIWQKEDLIAHGQPVFVELAPAATRYRQA